MTSLAGTLRDLRDRYLALHESKEDLFWSSKMGLTADADATSHAAAEAEIALNRFLQNPEELSSLRRLEQSAAGSEAERRTLRGWIALFAAHSIEDPAARALSERIVEAEAALGRARGAMALGYVDPATGQHVPAGSNKLALMMRTDPDEARRRAAFDGLRSVETFVLAHGFLDIVKQRNALGRMLGYEDYYDWRTSMVERLPKRDLFRVLDDLAARTADRTRAALADFAQSKRGDTTNPLEPWNFGFLRAGAITRELDPYFRFDDALSRWGRSFAALGVSYRGATLTLDLVDRAGKYENGFMHGPGPAFFADGEWRPARINFTANAVPGALGSGLRATETLFHEGGHAAHFSNILSDAPCFSQEFAPTSVAYAETQSMFMDSLLGDADWRVRYALDAEGRAMSMPLVEAAIRESQPLRGWDVRALMTVPFAERAIYELPDAELTPERVLETVRRVERELQGLESGVRPVLAVPHLLSGESSAYYHGYVLAEMAVYQTRAFFLARDGHLTDNPRIGPDLARAYWAPGNAATFDETLRALTGGPLSADALVEVCNRSMEETIAEARAAVEAQRGRPRFDGEVRLDAAVRVIHGAETVCSTEHGTFAEAAERFAAWVRAHAPAPAPAS
jgi:oligoendopeptidase F